MANFARKINRANKTRKTRVIRSAGLGWTRTWSLNRQQRRAR